MPSFSQLWGNHPTIKGDAPLLDPKVYSNQCAINLYAALQRSGFNVSSFSGQLSWQKDKPKYAIRAQELAAGDNRMTARLPLYDLKAGRHRGDSPVFELTCFRNTGATRLSENCALCRESDPSSSPIFTSEPAPVRPTGYSTFFASIPPSGSFSLGTSSTSGR